ncbi:MAG: transcription elongation factor subunit Spt4 [Nanobdellota archaeon]
MPKLKASRETKMLVEGNEDPLTGSKDLSTNWNGRVIVLDPNKSMIANEMGFKAKGEYAIKVR